MSIALIPAEPANDTTVPSPRGRYARYADIFSRVHAETGSIEIALEVLDTYRAREDLAPRRSPDLADRIVQVVARLFAVKPKQLFERNRHHDVTSARYVAAWLLLRRGWKKAKIATFFKLDHSTIIHGLRLVVADVDLLAAAHSAEQLLESADAISPGFESAKALVRRAEANKEDHV
jgi:hypothetical protein